MFLSAKVLSQATTQRNSAKQRYLHVQKFSRSMTKFLRSKRVVSSFYSKSLTFYGKRFQERSYLSETCPRRHLQNRYSCKDFRKFTGKHLYQFQYLMKLEAFSLQLYCKRDSSTDVYLQILWNI